MELPQTYTDKMKRLLGENEAEEYFASLDRKSNPGLRTNRLKIQPEQLKEALHVPLTAVSWIPEGFQYEEANALSKHPYYYAGLYYLQEPSAMTPAFMLSVTPGECVLDLCAAPGGKSTAIGAALQGKGFLLSNDISHSRAKALLKNIELAGITNACVTSETPEKLASVFPEFFDKVLVDAPCSGEGMFRKDPNMIKSWMERGPESYVPIQRDILLQAVRMLKPGGMLLYSTCTFDKEEDEGNVRFLIDTCPELTVQELPMFSGAVSGFEEKGCLRLFPHKLNGEGHFLAAFRKKKTDSFVAAPTNGFSSLPHCQKSHCQKSDITPLPASMYTELDAFFKNISWKLDKSRVFEKQGAVYFLPNDVPYHKELRYLRTGLLLGEFKKGRFEPSQALAMALKEGEFFNTLSLSLEDERVIRYLKGETLSLTEEESKTLQKGWCLVAVDGFSLGFAKQSGSSLKNKYYPGWRWQS